MPSCALTSELLAGLPLRVPRRGSVNYFDTETRGFMLEHRASGGATWYFRYRDAGGVVRQQRIGAYPELPLAQARVRALQMRERVDAGQAPQEVVRPVVALPTLAEFVASRYLPYVQSRKRSWALDEVLLRLATNSASVGNATTGRTTSCGACPASTRSRICKARTRACASGNSG
jgi:hypothetical protein